MVTSWVSRKSRSVGWYLGCGFLVLGVASCGGPQNQDVAQSSNAETEATTQTADGKPTSASPTALPDPMLTAIPPNQPPAASELVRHTPADARLSEITAGRHDPFAKVVQPLPGQLTARANRPAATTANASNRGASPAATAGTLPSVPAAAPAQVSYVPLAPAAPIALPPVVPLAPNGVSSTAALPPIPVPSQLPAPSSSMPLANSVMVSGVVQVGGKVSAIVSLPSEGSSRYVSVGDSLAGGSIRVKRIEIGPDQEPLVILEQNGQEYPRTVGSAIASFS